MLRRTALIGTLSALATFAWSATAAAQAIEHPTKPVRIVVPYSAGGPADLLARSVADKLGSSWKQPIIVDNRPGAGGHLGAEAVARGPADGHTLVLATIAHNGAFAMYKGLKYEPHKDLVPVILLAESANVLVVHPSVQASNVKEFIALAKSRPGQLNYGSAGTGSAMHMAAELFKHMAGVDLQHVPYKGGAPALSDALGGNVQVLFDSVATAVPHVRSGKLKPLAVTSTARNPSLPSVPTVAEAGLPGYAAVPWYTLSVARGTPPEVIRKLNADIRAVLKSPDLLQKWETLGLTPLGGTPEEAAQRNNVETQRWTQVIQAAGITVE